MSKASDMAFPVTGKAVVFDDYTGQHSEKYGIIGGLTKREYFAGLAMQQFIEQNQTHKMFVSNDGNDMTHAQMSAAYAVVYAEALLKELAK